MAKLDFLLSVPGFSSSPYLKVGNWSAEMPDGYISVPVQFLRN